MGRRDVDNTTPTFRFHRRQRRAHCVKRRIHVDVDDLVPATRIPMVVKELINSKS